MLSGVPAAGNGASLIFFKGSVNGEVYISPPFYKNSYLLKERANNKSNKSNLTFGCHTLTIGDRRIPLTLPALFRLGIRGGGGIISSLMGLWGEFFNGTWSSDVPEWSWRANVSVLVGPEIKSIKKKNKS